MILPRDEFQQAIQQLKDNDVTELELDGPETSRASSTMCIEEVGSIANALKYNSSLISMSLYSYYIKMEGAVAFVEALRVNSTLTSLELASTKITMDAMTTIAQALKCRKI